MALHPATDSPVRLRQLHHPVDEAKQVEDLLAAVAQFVLLLVRSMYRDDVTSQPTYKFFPIQITSRNGQNNSLLLVD